MPDDMMPRAIELFHGSIVDPFEHTEDEAGFQGFLACSGVRHFTAAEVPLRRVLLAGAALGLRAGEIVRAEWSWVDVTRRELRFPTTKNGRPKRVPLPPALWDLCLAEPRHPVRCAC